MVPISLICSEFIYVQHSPTQCKFWPTLDTLWSKKQVENRSLSPSKVANRKTHGSILTHPHLWTASGACGIHTLQGGTLVDPCQGGPKTAWPVRFFHNPSSPVEIINPPAQEKTYVNNPWAPCRPYSLTAVCVYRWGSLDFIRVAFFSFAFFSSGSLGSQLQVPDLSGHCRTSTASSREEGRRREEEKAEVTPIKSRDPHLASGETKIIIHIFFWITIQTCLMKVRGMPSLY